MHFLEPINLKHLNFEICSHGLCDELVDYNVIQVLPAIDANVAKANIAVIATRMDSFSLFSQSRGSDTSVLVSLISSLSIARSIGRNRLAFERMSRETKKQVRYWETLKIMFEYLS